MHLVNVDDKIKWLEMAPVHSTSSSATIMVLQDLFSRFGIRKSLLSDSWPGFISAELGKFLSNNVIVHIKTP